MLHQFRPRVRSPEIIPGSDLEHKFENAVRRTFFEGGKDRSYQMESAAMISNDICSALRVDSYEQLPYNTDMFQSTKAL